MPKIQPIDCPWGHDRAAVGVVQCISECWCECSICGAQGPVGRTREDAIAAWNRSTDIDDYSPIPSVVHDLNEYMGRLEINFHIFLRCASYWTDLSREEQGLIIDTYMKNPDMLRSSVQPKQEKAEMEIE